MKLLRFGAKGAESPGLIGPEGEIRDLSSVIEDITPQALTPDHLTQMAKIDPQNLPIVNDDPRIGPPIKGCGKFIGIGLNYADHAAETGQALPEEPVLFTKAITSIAGPNDDLTLPVNAQKADFEVELAFIMSTTARHVSPEDGLAHVAGFCVCNDVSERAWQMETTGQWLKGKSYDGFAPIGPWLVTTDELSDPTALDLYLDLNGERMQTGNTSNMVFNVGKLVSTISKYMTLMPGDIVTTGTPPGVGMARTPPRFLKAGDEIRLGVEGLGEQRQKVVVEPFGS